MTPTVLHVVEALGGGVMVAVRDYIRNTRADLHHVVIANQRPGHDTGDFDDVPVLELGGLSTIPRTLGNLRRAIRQVRPDVLHLHSSWAGLLGRSLPVRSNRIAYTPHCYAFERVDVPEAVRLAYRTTETVLARRTGLVVAVSPQEAELAGSLAPRAVVRYVPNTADVPREPRSARAPGPLRVMGSGRVTAQKDPGWFSDFARALLAQRPDVSITWLGGGEAAEEQRLRAAGVRVTGWLPRTDLLEELAQADVYLHSAAWEGAPLSVLEAAALGVPVIARDIPALRSLGLPVLHPTPGAAADWVGRADLDGRLARVAVDVRRLSERHTPAAQRTALLDAYRTLVPHAFG